MIRILPWLCRIKKPMLTYELNYCFHMYMNMYSHPGRTIRAGWFLLFTLYKNPGWTFITTCFLCYPIGRTLRMHAVSGEGGGGGGGQFAL